MKDSRALTIVQLCNTELLIESKVGNFFTSNLEGLWCLNASMRKEYTLRASVYRREDPETKRFGR